MVENSMTFSFAPSIILHIGTYINQTNTYYGYTEHYFAAPYYSNIYRISGSYLAKGLGGTFLDMSFVTTTYGNSITLNFDAASKNTGFDSTYPSGAYAKKSSDGKTIYLRTGKSNGYGHSGYVYYWLGIA